MRHCPKGSVDNKKHRCVSPHPEYRHSECDRISKKVGFHARIPIHTKHGPYNHPFYRPPFRLAIENPPFFPFSFTAGDSF